MDRRSTDSTVHATTYTDPVFAAFPKTISHGRSHARIAGS